MHTRHALQSLETSGPTTDDDSDESAPLLEGGTDPHAAKSTAGLMWHECRGFQAPHATPQLLKLPSSATSAAATSAGATSAGTIANGNLTRNSIGHGFPAQSEGEVRGAKNGGGGARMGGPGIAQRESLHAGANGGMKNGVKPAGPWYGAKNNLEASQDVPAVSIQLRMGGPGYAAKKTKLDHGGGGVEGETQGGGAAGSGAVNQAPAGASVNTAEGPACASCMGPDAGEVWLNVFVGGSGEVRYSGFFQLFTVIVGRCATAAAK